MAGYNEEGDLCGPTMVRVAEISLCLGNIRQGTEFIDQIRQSTQKP